MSQEKVQENAKNNTDDTQDQNITVDETPTEESDTSTTATEKVESQPVKDPVKTLTRNVLIVVAIIFVWYIAADRYTPWTDQARVQAYVIPVVSQVSGRVLEINVTQDTKIAAGQPLFQIDPSDYLLAVEQAETSLELAGQEIGAGMATVVTAQAQVVTAETNLEHVNAQSARVFELEEKNLYSKSEGDKARAAIKNANAQLASAVANLDKARQSLGPQGEDNPRIRSAMAQLKKAQLDLSRTKVLAPSVGGVTNLQIEKGYYANAGAPVMTFVEADNVWIQANLKENNLANLKVGAPVDIVLDVMPGKVYTGKVKSIGFAVANDSTQQAIGGLSNVTSSTGWLRDPQRFPVIIEFDHALPVGIQRVGGQADIQFYNQDSGVLNAIGKVWIRILSWFSYVY
jgi:multidrug resistance efflux pump